MATMKVAIIVTALLLTASAASARDVCVERQNIDGWGARDAHSLVVNDRFGKKYLLTVAGWCQDFDFSFGISFHGFGGNEFTCLERGDTIVPHGGGAMGLRGARCSITGIEAYTPQMEKAYREAKEAARAAKDESAKAPKDAGKQE
jgi:hypothetical protein